MVEKQQFSFTSEKLGELGNNYNNYEKLGNVMKRLKQINLFLLLFIIIIFRHQPKGGKSLIRSMLAIYLACFRCSCIKAVLLRQKVDHRYPNPQTTERHALRNHLFEVSVKRNQRVLYSRNSGLGVLSPESDLNPSNRVRLDSILQTLNIIQLFN